MVKKYFVQEWENGIREYKAEYDEKLWDQLGHTDTELTDMEYEEVHPLIREIWNDGYEIGGGDAQILGDKIRIWCFESAKDRRAREE